MAKQKLIVRSVRLDADLNGRVELAAKQHGFANASAFIREALHRSLATQENATEAAEQRIAAGIDRAMSEIRKVRRVQQAAFAFADTQIKMLLTCVAEPPKDVYDQAVAKGKLRYDRFLKSVGMGLAGGSSDAIKDCSVVGKKNNQEPEFRLRPHRPPPSGKSEAIAWSVALKTVFRYASTSARNGGAKAGQSRASRKEFNQRCAVRITYTKNKVAGQCRAHGQYIARESATRDGTPGFGAETVSVQPAKTLNVWQKQGDARLWKFIVSPEFGDRVDLQRLTRELFAKMERDLGTRLEWLAVNHFNTEHPHTHVALRGIRDDGSVLDLPREYVQSGIRGIAEDLCTRQLGYRTELDAREAERRKVDQGRVTSLDRIVERANPGHSNADANQWFKFETVAIPLKRDQAALVAARLITLQKMGVGYSSAVGVLESSIRLPDGAQGNAAGCRPTEDVVRPSSAGFR